MTRNSRSIRPAGLGFRERSLHGAVMIGDVITRYGHRLKCCKENGHDFRELF